MDETSQCPRPLPLAEHPAERSLPEDAPPGGQADYEWLQLALFPCGGVPRQRGVVLEPYGEERAGLVVLLGVLGAMTGMALAVQHRSGMVQQVLGTVLAFCSTAAVLQGLWAARLRRGWTPPRLVVSVQPVYLGERFTVRFQQLFRSGCRLHGVVLRLVCLEETVRRRGEEIFRQREQIFCRRQEVVAARDVAPGTQLAGQVEFVVPDDAMHSFSALNNRVRWRLELEIDVASGEVYREQFPLLVAPRRVDA